MCRAELDPRTGSQTNLETPLHLDGRTHLCLNLTGLEVFRRELTILGTFTNPYTTRRAVQLLAADPDRWRPLVTHVYPLAQFSEAWDIHQRGQGLKVCIRPNNYET